MTRTARLAARRAARRDRFERGVIRSSFAGALIILLATITNAAADQPAPTPKIGDQVGPIITCGKVESDCRPIYRGDGQWVIVFDPN